jgi:hypothetical protein
LKSLILNGGDKEVPLLLFADSGYPPKVLVGVVSQQHTRHKQDVSVELRGQRVQPNGLKPANYPDHQAQDGQGQYKFDG